MKNMVASPLALKYGLLYSTFHKILVKSLQKFRNKLQDKFHLPSLVPAPQLQHTNSCAGGGAWYFSHVSSVKGRKNTLIVCGHT